PVQRMGERHMTDPVHLELSGDAVGALGVTHYVYMVTGGGREKDLTRIIEVEDPESAIVFCNTKKETEQAAAYLQQAGFSADWLNGDLPQSEREKVMRRTREGKLRFLVATDVAARGIDISHVTHVINFALPEHLEQYIHRTGRTGRAGRTGTALSLVAPQELGTLYYLRLQYKIFPIERSLPSKGEEQTRREMDRVEMLAAAVKAKRPSAIDLAVAKRLLSHADAEGLLAGLVGSFFGASSDDVDETAAAARRERAPEPAAEEAPKAEAGGKKKRKPRRKRERSSERAPKAEAREPNGAPSEVPVAPEPVAPATEANAPETAEAAPAEPTSAGSDAGDANAERDDRSARRRRDEEEGFTRLYVNLGRRDNIRVGDLNEMFQEDGGLTREEVGRIRLRDKHSFVSVPEDKVEAVIEALRDIEVDGREVKIEVARN
ncbi:MAG: DEAD/DEAH box helicase, partial [Myxococcota bacterium]